MIKKKIFDNCYYILTLNLLILSFFIIFSFRPLPDSTHYLASFLDETQNTDHLNWIISYIKTPFYFIFGLIFQSPFFYFFSSYIINFIFFTIIYLFFNLSINNSFLSFLVTAFIVFLKFLILFFNFISFEDINFLNYFIMNVDLMGIFTVRQFFGIIFIISLFCLIKEKYWSVIILTFINNFTHPNSNIFSILIIGCFFIYLCIVNKISIKLFLYLILSNLFYLSYLFYNIQEFPNIPIESTNTNNSYYGNLIKDEADDFSFLWTWIYRLNFILCVIALHALNIIFYLRNYKFDNIILLTILPIFFFIAGSLMEYINLYLNFSIIDHLIINTQPAWKLLGYAFFPSMLLLVKNISNLRFFYILKFHKVVFYFSFITIIIFSSVGMSRNYDELKTYLKYVSQNYHEENYEDWAKTVYINDNYNFFPLLAAKKINLKINENYINEKNIILFKNEFHLKIKPQYKNIYDTEDVYKLIKNVKRLIPGKSGIIIPPYMLNARGIFKNHMIYFAEHPDGNFAMGNYKFFKIIHKRMIDLLGFGYSNFPYKNSKLNSTFLRERYLNLKEDNIIKVYKLYKSYQYFITEQQHVLNFPVVYKNKSFIVYEIK